MKISQVAVQMYSVRDFLKTPKEIAASCKKIRKIGYTAVQASGLGPIEDAEFVKIVKDAGLDCFSTHEDSGWILKKPAEVVAKLKRLGCNLTAYPYPSMPLDSLANVKKLAKALNAAGKVFHQAGMVLTYHNHHVEFKKFGGKTALEILYDETDPRYLKGEIDTYWVQTGGSDPVAWMKKLRRRLPMIHLKDYKVTADHKTTFAEIGNGNLDFKAIIKEAEASGCKWFIVEQDTCPGDPFDSLKMSFDYIKKNLVG
jgi:sugar phosphate isomerase/epimerase